MSEAEQETPHEGSSETISMSNCALLVLTMSPPVGVSETTQEEQETPHEGSSDVRSAENTLPPTHNKRGQYKRGSPCSQSYDLIIILFVKHFYS